MAVDFYYYQQLDKKKKILYKSMYDAVTKYESSIAIANLGYSQDDINQVYQAVLNDNPHFFYFDQRSIKYRWNQDFVEIYFNYLLSISDCMKFAKKINESAEKILEYVALSDKSDYEKVRGIHDILSGRVSYAYEWLNATVGMEFLYAHSILGVFCKKKSVCEGIAKAYKLLLNALGVKCIVVCGKFRSENGHYEEHAWNIVKIDGKTVHIDPTNDICNSTKDTINYDYFCVTDKQLSKTHSGYCGVPACSDNCFDYFNMNGTDMLSEKQLFKYVQKKVTTIPCEIYMRINYECGKSFTSYANNIRNFIVNEIKNSEYGLVFNAKYNEQQKTIRISVNIRV